ncbi:hypothetical protein GGI02_000590 [Coemansia sp. RSA 2322]|nr:hypothetical protein GGI02_000590 [Coemansia sp. RSA 2322]
MPDFSSNTDFTGMGMGMGVGAGMMSAMDDSIPHLSLDENAHDTTRGMSHLPAPSSANAGAYPHAAGSNMLPMRRQSFFDYGLTGTGNVPLGNTISEEMHKVSSWLLQSQGHQPEALQPYSASSAAFPIPTVHRSSIDGSQHATHAFLSHSMGLTSPLGRPPDFPATTPARVLSASAARGTFSTDIWAHNPYNGYAPQARPPSDSELSIKRKASHEQIDQPRKARGNVWSPVRETAPSLLPASSAAGAAYDGQCNGAITNMMRIGQALALSTGDGGDDVHAHGDVADANSAAGGDEGSADGERSNRQDGRRNQQKAVLTESERRANHIASEQRRRNQIRQGYAELMDLVTTLRDPALGNHPGTAQSTPSKAVILAHAVQFIRGLEEGNRLLRKRLEGTRHFLPPMHFASQALAALRSHSNDPPQ